MENDYIITTKDVAKLLRVTPEFVRKLIKKGHLHPTKIGSVYLYDGDEVSQYIMKLELD